MSKLNKKGKERDFYDKAIEDYVNFDPRYDVDSSELEVFKRYVRRKMDFIKKEELMNAENTINELILDFIEQYCISVLFCLSISLSLNL